MTRKYPICPERIRTIPEQFSWVDQRLVRDRHIEGLNHQAAALYLFLVTVADYQGLSYYSDSGLAARLTMDEATLAATRHTLQCAGLLAYKKPLYQVLALEGRRDTRGNTAVQSSADAGLVSLRDILHQLTGERT